MVRYLPDRISGQKMGIVGNLGNDAEGDGTGDSVLLWEYS